MKFNYRLIKGTIITHLLPFCRTVYLHIVQVYVGVYIYTLEGIIVSDNPWKHNTETLSK